MPSIRIISLYGSRPSSCGFCMHNSDLMDPNKQISMGPRDHLSFCACNTAWLAPELLVSIRSQPLSVVFVGKTAIFGTEQQVSMGPRHHLSFCACKTACLALRITSIYVSQTSSVRFVDVKQGLLDQKYKSLWDPDLTCRFVLAKQWLLNQWTSIYVCADLHLWFCGCKTGPNLDQNNKSNYGSQTFTCRFVHAKRRDFSTRVTSLYWLQPSPASSVHEHNSVICTRMTSLYVVPALICGFVHAKQRL